MKFKQGRIKQTIKSEQIIFIYMACAVILEMISVFAVEGNPLIKNPAFECALLALVAAALFGIRRNSHRTVICTILLIVQCFADMVFVSIYNMTGQYFEMEMLSLRNDAMGILEGIPVDTFVFFASVYIIISFGLIAVRISRRHRVAERNSQMIRRHLILGAVLIFIAVLSVSHYASDFYSQMIENKNSSAYTQWGILGNLGNQAVESLFFSSQEKKTAKEMEDFLYQTAAPESENFGISEGNNLVVILAESFEWFSFMNVDSYRESLGISDTNLRRLYPNLWQFYDDGMVMTNYHSKEKTDISETLSLLGSYPTSGYVDYDYQENTIPQALPNVLKLLTEDGIVCNSFHNGTRSFYNRPLTHEAFGFDNYFSSQEMYEWSKEQETVSGKELMHDYISDGERNLDSEMIDVCQDYMFPKDTRFFTYITSITMHGMYYERENLTDYRRQLRDCCPYEELSEDQEILLNYMSTVMEFDRAIGRIMEELDERELLDHTTVVLFGDHNAYYQNLSAKIKGISDYNTEQCYTDLYRIPFIIYDKNLGSGQVDKFVCTADIMPTILDLFGIRYYENMYYGTSVFRDEITPLYSRAYNFFVGKGMVFRSLNQELYRDSGISDAEAAEFKRTAKKLVEKISYCDQIFAQDYYSERDNRYLLEEKLKILQDRGDMADGQY